MDAASHSVSRQTELKQKLRKALEDGNVGAMITGEELESSFFMYQMDDTYDSDSEHETDAT